MYHRHATEKCDSMYYEGGMKIYKGKPSKLGEGVFQAEGRTCTTGPEAGTSWPMPRRKESRGGSDHLEHSVPCRRFCS